MFKEFVGSTVEMRESELRADLRPLLREIEYAKLISGALYTAPSSIELMHRWGYGVYEPLLQGRAGVFKIGDAGQEFDVEWGKGDEYPFTLGEAKILSFLDRWKGITVSDLDLRRGIEGSFSPYDVQKHKKDQNNIAVVRKNINRKLPGGICGVETRHGRGHRWGSGDYSRFVLGEVSGGQLEFDTTSCELSVDGNGVVINGYVMNLFGALLANPGEFFDLASRKYEAFNGEEYVHPNYIGKIKSTLWMQVSSVVPVDEVFVRCVDPVKESSILIGLNEHMMVGNGPRLEKSERKMVRMMLEGAAVKIDRERAEVIKDHWGLVMPRLAAQMRYDEQWTGAYVDQGVGKGYFYFGAGETETDN